ncbi:MAG: hypothetical protein NTW30_05345 [Candidatus Aenigmarchaeota archaeon]|nr:hypothetical protein [Candidatus Aenigmarchaeota archaeon]
MVYKKIAIMYVAVLALIFSLSLITADKNMMKATQLSLSQSSFLIVVIAVIVLVIIFVVFTFYVKKNQPPIVSSSS